MSHRTRWVRDPEVQQESLSKSMPPLPNLEAVYLTDPALLAEVLPPPLTPPAEPRVHVRLTDIDLTFGEHRHKELVGYFAVDAEYEGQPGEYPLLIPIDLEPAVAISRERFGEPKKLADLALTRDGDRVTATMTREGVTFAEIDGHVTGSLPVPDPYPARQFWFKFLPAVSGTGFDAGPLLVRMEQIRKPESVEAVDGKLVLRDLASCPVADLPVEELVSIQWVRRSSENNPEVIASVDPEAFAPYAAARY
jgi:acetoacetate decarboxylase